MGMHDRDWWRERYDENQGRSKSRPHRSPNLDAYKRAFEKNSIARMLLQWAAILAAASVVWLLFTSREIGAWLLSNERVVWASIVMGGGVAWYWWNRNR